MVCYLSGSIALIDLIQAIPVHKSRVLNSVEESVTWISYVTSQAFVWMAVRAFAVAVFILTLMWRDFLYSGDV